LEIQLLQSWRHLSIRIWYYDTSIDQSGQDGTDKLRPNLPESGA